MTMCRRDRRPEPDLTGTGRPSLAERPFSFFMLFTINTHYPKVVRLPVQRRGATPKMEVGASRIWEEIDRISIRFVVCPVLSRAAAFSVSISEGSDGTRGA